MNEAASDQGATNSCVTRLNWWRKIDQCLNDRRIISQSVRYVWSHYRNRQPFIELALLATNHALRELGRSHCRRAGAEEE